MATASPPPADAPAQAMREGASPRARWASVVDGDDPGLRPPAYLRGQVGGEGGVPHGVHAAVEVENHVPRLDSVDRDLRGWDAAQRGRGHGHLGRQRLRREQLPEQPPLLVHVGAGGKGRLSQDGVEGLAMFDAQ